MEQICLTAYNRKVQGTQDPKWRLVNLQRPVKFFKAISKQLQVPRPSLLIADCTSCSDTSILCWSQWENKKCSPDDQDQPRNHQCLWACTPVCLSTGKPVLYHHGEWENQDRSPWSKSDTFKLDESNVFLRNVLWSNKAKVFECNDKKHVWSNQAELFSKKKYTINCQTRCWYLHARVIIYCI